MASLGLGFQGLASPSGRPNASKSHQLPGVDGPRGPCEASPTELARHGAWQSHAKADFFLVISEARPDP